MPSFLHPTLLWTLGLPSLAVVAIPVLIHLINMMRHRRVEWAAMEFLLRSQKKHRTWVIFKQLLLLLMRMAAVAAVVLLVAQPRLRSQWSDLLGGVHTHHIVLLDDSYSMSDRWADTDAFAEAKKVVGRIAADAAHGNQAQSFSLLRFSRSGGPQKAAWEMTKQPIGSDFAEKLAPLMDKMRVTQTAAEPLAALQAVRKLLGVGTDEQRVLYLVSDFRARQWDRPAELRKELAQWGESGTDIRLINCADRARPNLAIVSLLPVEGIRAAGVPWQMDVVVRNYGQSPARKVPVILGEDGHGRPGVVLDEIAPGKTAKERFLVHFPHAGPHDIVARLEADAVAADNYRYFTTELPADVPVLLVDSDAKARDARYFAFALAPGEAVRTGVRPQIEMPRYLATKPLADFQAIALANVDRLDSSAVAALEKYVAGGGGVAFFLGARCDVKFYNDALYRDGKGLLPAPLARESQLLVDRLDPAPDVQVEPHFVFRVLAGKRNSFLQTVKVDRYFSTPEGWQPSPDSTVRVIARLRNGAPLAVERRFGKGRVVVVMTSAAPTWNSWARNPSFVVVAQDLAAYLAQGPTESRSLVVGSPLELRLDPAAWQPQVRFLSPEQGGSVASVNAVRGADGMLRASLVGTEESGFYEAQLARTSSNAPVTRRYAVNVDPAEGDLARLGGEQLASRLQGIKYRYQQAAAYQAAATEVAGSNLAEAILYGLILLLIAEQILAWSASYHPARRHARGGAA
ncbi:MAG: BatA domain-containing protein [Planctomycetaceae bacterium]|nr:BatA domain-containing protein [Planctomycetaceae bacterium]